jgi:D-amino-acid dehydrogenase
MTAVGIVGAGIIGISTACVLSERGYSVTVFDPADPGEGGASRANAAHVIPSVIHPLASPATLRRAFRLLTDPDSPLILPAGHALAAAPWLAAFARASLPSRWRRGVAALTAINRHAWLSFEALVARAGRPDLLRRAGAIQVHETAASLEAGLARLRAVPPELTGGVTLLDTAALRAAEPALGAGHAGGILIPSTGVLSDPLEVVAALSAHARARGAIIRRARVARVRPTARGADLLLEGGETAAFDRVVVAAGAWSRPILRDLGEPRPLLAERGYNLTVVLDRPAITRALLFPDRGVVATSVTSGLRLGGWDELGPPDRPPDPRLFRRLAALAERLLPGFDWPGATPWMGPRPSLPDSLPLIGPSHRHPGVLYALGHGHLGMTQGPATGEAIAALVAGEPPPFDLAPFGLR